MIHLSFKIKTLKSVELDSFIFKPLIEKLMDQISTIDIPFRNFSCFNEN